MRNFVFVSVCALALVACNPQAQQEADAPAEAPLDLACAAFADANGDSLAQRFGADNLRDETLPGVEGDEYQATVVYPDDRARRIEVVWRDHAARSGVWQVTVSGDSSGWTGPSGVALGMSIDQIQAANGGPFTVTGFGWDMGGWVVDWRSGALAQNGCRIGMRFQPRGDYSGAAGDVRFASDSAEMRAADPRVMELSLGYPEQ